MLRLSALLGPSRFRAIFTWLLPALFALGCGGGGNSGPAYSLDVTPASLSFSAEQNGPLPPTKTLSVAYKGDGLVAGYPTGSPEPGWLSVQLTSSTASTATLSVRVSSTSMPPGTYTTTLRVITGKADGTNLVTRDIPISCQVTEGIHSLTSSLAFTADEGQAPAAQTLSLASGKLPFSWTLAVEPLHGGPTDWLVLPATSGSSQTSPATVQVQASARPQGSYSATLVVKDAGGQERGRIPVTYQVNGVYTLTGTFSAQVTESARLADLDLPLLVQTRLDGTAGAGHQWQITSSQPWLSVSPASGSLSANTQIVARLDPAKLWAMPNGAYTATLTLSFTGGSATPTTVPVNLALSLWPTLKVDEAAAFSVRGGTTSDQLAKSLKVSSNLGEAFAGHSAWHATAQGPWLAATPTGDAGANNTLTLALQSAALAGMASGQYDTTVSVLPDDARLAAATAHATLALALPAVTHVAPYCTWVNRAGEVILRGNGFSGQATLPVRFGTATVQGVVVSDTEIRVQAPAQAAPGRVPVAIDNALGLARGSADLVVLPEPAYGAVDLPLGGSSGFRLVLDPERQAVLMVGSGAIMRFRWSQGAWTTDSYPLPSATGVAVTQDGKDLLMTAGGVTVSDLFLRVDPETFAIRASTGYNDFYSSFNLIAGFNDGSTLLIDSDQWAESVWYPGLTQGPWIDAHGAVILLTRDRSRLMTHTTTSSSAATQSYDVAEGVFRSQPISAFFGSKTWGISQDGGRLVAANTVYDRAFAYLGALTAPETWIDSLAVAQDGKKVYTLAQDAGNAWILRRTDISGAMGPYPADAAPLPFALPSDSYPLAMVVSEDGSTLFILANQSGGAAPGLHFFAVPLP